MKKYIKYIAVAIIGFSLVACSRWGTLTSEQDNSAAYKLQIDGVSPVPLVNGESQPFYVYVKNIGTVNASNLNWSLNNIENIASTSSIINKIKSIFNKKDTSTNNAITIVNSNDCINIAVGQTCRVLLQGVNSATSILQSAASSSNSNVIAKSTVSTYTYAQPITVASDSVLTVSPITTVNYANGFTGYSFFIINNGTLAVSLNNTSLGTLPSGLDYKILIGKSCPTPLPGGQVCQVRLTIGSSVAVETNTISLTPTGSVINSDGTTTVLPSQNSVNLVATNENVGNPVSSNPSLSVFSNATASATAMITNTGSANVVLRKLSSGNSDLVISNDNCSGKTLAVGDVCYYKLSINGASINGAGSAVISIPYNDGKADGTNSVTVPWTYQLIVLANPSITLTNSGDLTQAQTSSAITVTNNGNVALSYITPTLTTLSSNVTMTGSCPSVLESGQLCTYTLTYNPSAPSENKTVTVGSISASYVDENGVTKTKTFSASTGLNVSSVFTGFIATSGDVSLSESHLSQEVTLRNIGNYNAVISSITLDDSNISWTSGSSDSCTQTTSLSAGASCTLTLKLVATSGSGVAHFKVIYNNSNGNSLAEASGNINWIVGNVPSLNVSFKQSNLFALVSGESSTEVVLYNNGNEALNNITIPSSPSSDLVWSNNDCVMSGSVVSSLAIGASCKLKLTYSPIIAVSGTSVSIGSFSATLTDLSTYTTASYSITKTAVTNNALSFGGATDLTQNASWVDSAAPASVVVTNVGNRTINITGTSVSGVSATASGCSGNIAPGNTCTLTVTGNSYTSSGSGVVNLQYSDGIITGLSQSLQVIVNYIPKPIISPGLAIAKNPSGDVTLFNDGSTTSPIQLTLTNATTVTNSLNSNDAQIRVNRSSLLPSTDGSASYVESPAIGSCLVESDGYITLSSGETCTYNILASSPIGTVASSGASSKTISYNYNQYSNSSTSSEIKVDGSATYVVSYTIQTTQALLSTPVLSSGTTTSLLNVLESTSNPSISFSLQNVGKVAISGAITAGSVPVGLSIDTSSCSNLAKNASCTITVTMDTSSLITLSSLSAITLSYIDSNNSVPKTVSLPGIQYSVVNTQAPVITASMKGVYCTAGTLADNAVVSSLVTVPTCLINTGNAAPEIHLTFSNSGGTVTNFTADINAFKSALGSGYDVTNITNTCNSVTLANGDTCDIVIPNIEGSTSSDDTTMYDILSASNGLVAVNYSYDYGGTVVSASANFGVDSTVASASMSVSPSPLLGIGQGRSESVLLTVSNWFSSTPPLAPSFTFAGPNAFNYNVTTISADTCNFSAPVSYGSSCSSVIRVASTAVVDSYTMYFSSSNVANTTSASGNATFNVLQLGWQYLGGAGGVTSGTATQIGFTIANDGTLYFGYGGSMSKYNGTSWDSLSSVTPNYRQPSLVTSSTGIFYTTLGFSSIEKYNGTGFVQVGESISAADPGSGAGIHALAIDQNDNDTLYFAYESYNNNGLYVKKFNGTNWTVVGSSSVNSGYNNYINLKISSVHDLYVAYSYGSVGFVKKFNSVNNTWESVGATGKIFNGTASYISLALDSSNTPYVAYAESSSAKAAVKKFNSVTNTWDNVGASAISVGKADYTNLAISADNTLYLAYLDNASISGIVGGLVVKKYVAGSWVTVGSNSLVSQGSVYWVNLSTYNNIPYVAFEDNYNGYRGSVMYYIE